MRPASESVSNETEAAAWLDNISFCSGFCEWIDEELIDSLPADSQPPVESTRASEAVSAQPCAEKSPTGQIILQQINPFISLYKNTHYVVSRYLQNIYKYCSQKFALQFLLMVLAVVRCRSHRKSF